jgi:hypothetical protein
MTADYRDERRDAMSYLLTHAAQRPTSFGCVARAARVDERTALNLPDFDGGAYVRVFVEDTTGRKRRRDPRIRLRIGDCSNTIALEFGVASPESRENSLHKIDTLLGALGRFRDALAAEADLNTRREGGSTCRT